MLLVLLSAFPADSADICARLVLEALGTRNPRWVTGNLHWEPQTALGPMTPQLGTGVGLQLCRSSCISAPLCFSLGSEEAPSEEMKNSSLLLLISRAILGGT